MPPADHDKKGQRRRVGGPLGGVPALAGPRRPATPRVSRGHPTPVIPASSRDLIGAGDGRPPRPYHLSPRCGAKTRAGTPCRGPAVRGKRRCRMHGGAAGSGAPKGNQNALKHGRYTRFAIEERRLLQALIRKSKRTLADLG